MYLGSIISCPCAETVISKGDVLSFSAELLSFVCNLMQCVQKCHFACYKIGDHSQFNDIFPWIPVAFGSGPDNAGSSYYSVSALLREERHNTILHEMY